MRIPLHEITTAIESSADREYEMVVLPGPVYFVEINGEVNAVYGISPGVPLTMNFQDFYATLKKHKVPKAWRN